MVYFRKDIGYGIVFPLMDEGTFTQSFTLKDKVKTNILNVLLTERGERLYMPNFGCGLKNLLFDNNIDVQQLKEIIIEQLNRHVPEVTVEEVQTEQIEHTLKVTLSYIVPREGRDAIEININSAQPEGGLNLSDAVTIA